MSGFSIKHPMTWKVLTVRVVCNLLTFVSGYPPRFLVTWVTSDIQVKKCSELDNELRVH